ncbi:MAG: OmpA family protein [Methylococcaceae bacterium]|nr:OmpA family protein [Methylococcaceae bacterium]
MQRILMIAFCGLLVTGCSGTRVVLVPDPDGKVGQVSVATQAGEAVLHKSGETTRASASDSKPANPEVWSQDQIQDVFAAALANEPLPPQRHRIHFATGTADLPAEAGPVLQAIKQAVEQRKSCDISVIGHSDRAGDDAWNRDLSLKRADAVARALKLAGIADACMDIRYYGEHDPVVPTADGVSEPRNRRVEVEIR